MKTATFFDTLAKELPAETLEAVSGFVLDVEEELLAQVKSPVNVVEQIGELTRSGGGKRLRPALVYLSAASTSLHFDKARTIKLGAALEMVHMATLIHDDVIDDAATRRGRPTAFSVYGNTASILGGDVLLSKAMAILAEDGDLAIIRLVSQAVVELTTGEVRELQARGDIHLAEQEHFDILRMKTASFIECCCRVGTLVAGANANTQTELGNFGHHIGMAFQIADDILDYRGDQRTTGKPLATDFRDAQATLPLIALLPGLTEEERTFTTHKFGNGVTDDDLHMIVGWMEQRGGFQYAEDVAQNHVREAVQSLGSLPDSPERKLLASVADFVVTRKS